MIVHHEHWDGGAVTGRLSVFQSHQAVLPARRALITPVSDGGDSQNLTADVWVELALAGVATSRRQIRWLAGAELERIRWGIGLIRQAASDRIVQVGAYINVAVDPDRDRARRLVRGSVSFARQVLPALRAGPRAGLNSASAVE